MLKKLLGIREGYIEIEKIAWKIAEHERKSKEAHILANLSSLRFSKSVQLRSSRRLDVDDWMRRGTDPKASPEGRKRRSKASAMRRFAETG